MSRIPPVDKSDAGMLGKVGYRVAARRFGEVPEPMAVTQHNPKVARAQLLMEVLAQRASKTLPANIRELAVYRAAWAVGCSWCVDFGAMLQRLDGLDVERLAHISDYETSDLYTDDERAAIAYADAMSGDVAEGVTDEQVADLERRFGRAGLVELTFQIGLENMRARMNSALGIHEQGFNTEACELPAVASSGVASSGGAYPGVASPGA